MFNFAKAMQLTGIASVLFSQTFGQAVTIPGQPPAQQQQSQQPQQQTPQVQLQPIYQPPTYQQPTFGNAQDSPQVTQQLQQLQQQLSQIQQQQAQLNQQQALINQRLQQVESSTNWYSQPAPGQPSPQDTNPFQLHMAP